MEMSTLKYLEYAAAVARYGTLTKAAQKLYLAQPNLSRAISELERSLGFPLFIRTRQGMVLTAQGERFLPEAEKLLRQLGELAEECRQQSGLNIRLSCMPSSLYINTVLALAHRLQVPLPCEEYSNCVKLFDSVITGKSLAALITLGVDKKQELLDYMTRRKLCYHMLGQSCAYGMVYRNSSRYHPEARPPCIDYQDALLMVIPEYFEPIGIHYDLDSYPFPAVRGLCRGRGRAGNLDTLEAMDDLVMFTCHIHTKTLARNGLVLLPLHPERTVYEYGYVTYRDQTLGPDQARLLAALEDMLREELAAYP